MGLRAVMAVILFGVGTAHAEECPTIQLDDLATGYVVASAQLEVERRIVASSVVACRTDLHTWASLQTVREPQVDGSTRWDSVECNQPLESTHQWTCSSIPRRSVPLSGVPQVPVTEVSLLVELKVEDAQRLVQLVYASLPRLTDDEVCAGESGVRHDADAMRRSFTKRGPSELTIYDDEQRRGTMVERNLHRVLLQADPDHPAGMRVVCYDGRAYLDDG